MVWSGLYRAEAAKKAGLADSSLRFALRKPHVLAAVSLNDQVILTSKTALPVPILWAV